MAEPALQGIPLSLVFLYFLWYSFLGWALETLYCSLKARRLVGRGFLVGPVCPIYGVGALVMILLLAPLAGHPVLLYLIACVVLSAWEYLVAWVLETTTHVKYWDYSHLPWNLHGRICLSVSLWWGILANVTLRVIHPATQRLFAWAQPPLRWWIAGVLGGLLVVDAAVTIRKLAATTRLLELAEQAREELAQKQQELRRQLAQSARRGMERRDQMREDLQQAGRQLADTAKLQAALGAMELRHSQLLDQAVRQSRRFRRRYQLMTGGQYQRTLDRIRERASRLRREEEDKRA